MSVKGPGGVHKSYDDYIGQLRTAIEGGDLEQIRKAKRSFEGHVSGQSGKTDVKTLFREKDRDLLEKLEEISREQLREQLALPKEFKNLFVQEDKNKGTAPKLAGTNPLSSANQVDPKKVAASLDAQNTDPKTVDGAGAKIDATGETDRLAAVLQGFNPKAAAILAPMVAALNSPELAALAATEKDAKKLAEAFGSNRELQDGLALMNKPYSRLSKETRDALQAEADARTKATGKPVKASDIKKEIQEKLAAGLGQIRNDAATKVTAAAGIDVGPLAGKLSPEQLAIVKEHNALLASAEAKIKGGKEKDLTPEEMGAMATGNDVEGLLSRAGKPVGPAGDELAKKLDALRQKDPAVWRVMVDTQTAKAEFRLSSDRAYNEIMSLLNSGLPIETVIMLVLARLTEKHEDKLKLKLKEAAAVEALERYNNSATERAKATGKEPELLNPADYGLSFGSSMAFAQELQVHQQQYSQMLQALTSVMRQIQDMIMTIIRNIRQ